MTHHPRIRIVSFASALGVWVSAASGVAQEPAPADVRSEPPGVLAEDAPAPAAFALDATINNVSFNHSIHFDQNGKQQGENHNLSLNFRLKVRGDQDVLSSGNVRLTRAVSDAGEDLVNHQHRHRGGIQRQLHHVLNQQRHHHRNQQDIHGHAQLNVPTLPATRLVDVAGVVEVQLGVGPMRQAVLGPFEQVEGRRARVEGVDGSRIVVDEHNGQLRLQVSQPVVDTLHRVRVYDAHGGEQVSNGWSGGHHNGQPSVTLNIPADPGCRVVFELFERIDTVEAEFSLTDVPLPVLKTKPAGVELVLKPTPIDPGGFRAELPEAPVVIEEN